MIDPLCISTNTLSAGGGGGGGGGGGEGQEEASPLYLNRALVLFSSDSVHVLGVGGRHVALPLN